MENKYVLLVSFVGNPVPEVMNNKDTYVSATEENTGLLLGMGKKLKEDGLIANYQLALLVGKVH